ncbi:MAG: hypothetical protein PHT12_04735 [Patescibacteria group bacterium]|nr:hypothetical protein [Patescibacteria group bacterium]
MYLILHAALGSVLAVAKGRRRPLVAFAVGWLSHYFLDAVPHGDGGVVEWIQEANSAFRLALVGGAEILGIGLCIGFIGWRKAGVVPLLTAASLGSAMPDIVNGFELLTKFHLRVLEPLHRWCHATLEPWFPSVPLSGQVILSIMLWLACSLIAGRRSARQRIAEGRGLAPERR